MAKLHETGERNLTRAMTAIVDSYNNTVHSSHEMVPLEAEKPENIARVINKIQQKRDHILIKNVKKFQAINNQFKVGDKVRYRLPKGPFTKESENYFSEEVYRIVGTVPTHPIESYKIADENSDFILLQSFLPEQLLLVDEK